MKKKLKDMKKIPIIKKFNFGLIYDSFKFV